MLSQIKNAYFIGIGGIGMSAIARYFKHKGINVSGYDKTPTLLSNELIMEGIPVHYEEDIAKIPKNVDVVIYTPAIPETHAELQFYISNKYNVKKRSEMLGIITQGTFTIAVAGTHGKTTVCSLITHILKRSGYDCTAFVGGIMNNYGTNFVLGNNNVFVVEADEYDRSFLQLYPNITVITATDADHLDIYENKQDMNEAYLAFAHQIKENGHLIVKQGIEIQAQIKFPQLCTYHLDNLNANVYCSQIAIQNGSYIFDVYSIFNEDFGFCELYMGGQHNIENALAAITVAQILGIDKREIKSAISNFKGIKRRFEYLINTPQFVFIDDYAHHPEEIKSFLNSVKQIYPDKKITAIFQPHLYSRTRDFAKEFAQALSIANEVLLLDIYPARELPLPGITSQIIFDNLTCDTKQQVTLNTVLNLININQIEVLCTIGAGNIDTILQDLKDEIQRVKNN